MHSFHIFTQIILPGGNIPGPAGRCPMVSWAGGGMATPLPGCANGLFAILPALNAAVVASIKCWACSSIHF